MVKQSVLVTGGASFIGSHLVDSLLKKGATVKVADDFSSGKLSNLRYQLKESQSKAWSSDNLSVFQGDLKDKTFVKSMMQDVEVSLSLGCTAWRKGIYRYSSCRMLQQHGVRPTRLRGSK